MTTFTFNYFEPTNFTLEFILNNGTTSFNLNNDLVEKHFFLGKNDNTFSVFLEKGKLKPEFRFYNKNFEIIISRTDLLTHLSVTVTDTRFLKQTTLFTQNVPVEKLNVQKNGERLVSRDLLRILYDSFKGNR